MNAPSKQPIVLHIDGQRTGADTALANWSAEVYAIDGLARGAGVAVSLELDNMEQDAVLEFELASGERLLVAAVDAGRYLAARPGSDAGGATALDVNPVLRLDGVRAPPGLMRDGLGAWIVKSLRVFRQGPAGMTALIAAGTFQDAQLGDRNGLYRCAGDDFSLTKVAELPGAAEPTLLFIHGTASSTHGSFDGLWRNESYRQKIVAAYDARIYAFEHRSLTESPIDNALALVKTLPQGARLHVVSHSRGGLVGELLARANRTGPEPFTEAEVAHFFAQAERGGREGFDAQAQALRELNRELVKRKIRVERFVRVACPARGTTLASGRLDRWASIMLNLVGKGVGAVSQLAPVLAAAPAVYGLFKSFLLTVVQQRCDARVLPGLEALMPDSPLVGLLCAPDVKIDAKLHVVAGDFEGEGLLPWLGDCVSEVFYGSETDLIVNTPSMAGGAERALGIFQKPVRGPQVTHFSYFEYDESALALLAALAGDDSAFTLLPGPSEAVIARGGKETKHKPNAPIAILLPGIMGSHIRLNGDRIWFDPIDMIAGKMEMLRIDANGVAADGWLDAKYENLARYLADSHELRPFAYDWRVSISEEAERFGVELDNALSDAEGLGKPLRIVAHSMGGLVARLALAQNARWQRFKKNPGNRLLQLGTPNHGSHAIAAVLMGRDDFVQTIERWFDWKHDMHDFLAVVRDFPGVLELLPWPGENGKADDGVDYFDARQWQDWYAQDTDPKKKTTWLPPQAGPLAAARAAINAIIRNCTLDAERTIYVAGCAPTPCAVRLADGRVEIGWSEEGDGRVLWKTGIPPGASVWYADAAHGDLADHAPAFESYRELLENGSTTEGALKRLPPAVRGTAVPSFRARGLEGGALYPSAEEVLAAALGGARPGTRTRTTTAPPAEITAYHASLASAHAPVLIGAYANDSLRGSAEFLNAHLANQLARSRTLGLYPEQPREAKVFFHPEKNGKPAGAIVVGLGSIGELTPGRLTRTLTAGLLEYARSAAGSGSSDGLEVCALLVGTGFTGLTVELGVRCLAEALRDANAKLTSVGMPTRIARLFLFEEAESRALAAVAALRDAVRDPRFAALRFDGRLRTGSGGYRDRTAASDGKSGDCRVLITADDPGLGLRFTIISDRARNEVITEPDQRQAIDGLIAAATGSLQDSARLSCSLFQLMAPNGFKTAIAELRTLMLSVDPSAAAYPWELMRDTGAADIAPLAARVELVRQLASRHGRQRPSTATAKRALIIGDTQSGRTPLPGAQQEAVIVAKLLKDKGIHVDPLLIQADTGRVFTDLLCGDYRFLHLAGHGEVNDLATGFTGMVLGPNKFLTAAQIANLPYVPEFVFINCCHLGSMAPDAATDRQRRWGELAANLATAFIEIGCKAVVAAGWAVNDDAAKTFAHTFYTAMLDGQRFGQALLMARYATYDRHRQSNTWGAFQAYGDERYRFPETDETGEEDEIVPLPSHLVADLDKLAARLQGATDNDKKNYYRKRLEAMEAAAHHPDCRSTAIVAEKLGDAWAAFGDDTRAIAHYRAALDAETTGASLRMIEKLANLEIRVGAKLAMDNVLAQRDAGNAYVEKGKERLDLLAQMGETTERLSLFGSYWRHLARIAHARGEDASINKHLHKMFTAYWEAAVRTYSKSGEWDHYPLFNALDGAFLLLARGASNPFDAPLLLQDGGPPPGASDLLAAGAANARRRFADDRDFFHSLAVVDAQRIAALLAAIAAGTEGHPVSADFLDAVIDDYRSILRNHGSAHEHASAANQPRFLLDLLPENETTQGIASALRKLIAVCTRH